MIRSPSQPEQTLAIRTLHTQVRQLLASLPEQCPTLRSYVLIERGLHPKLGWLAKQLEHTAARAILFENTPEAHLAETLSPWLVTIPQPIDDGQLYVLCNAAQQFGGICWIWSTWPLPRLANHLRTFMGGTLHNAATQEEEGEIALRLTDARVFPGICAALTTAQQTELLRPIHTLGIWNRQLQWQTWHGTNDAEDFAPTPLRISTMQLEAMNRHTQADKILSLLAEEYSQAGQPPNPVYSQLLSLPQDARYRAVQDLLNTGREIGYETDPDLLLFVSLAYVCHPDFHAVPGMRRAMEAGVHQEQSLATTLATLPDKVWQEIEHQPTRISVNQPAGETRS